MPWSILRAWRNALRVRHILKSISDFLPIDLLVLPLWACDPFHTSFANQEPAQLYEATKKTSVQEALHTLRVMTWNIKFGGGRIDFFFDGHGDRVLMNKEEVLTHLEGLAAKIKSVDPDILLVQEIDLNSKRSAYINQLQFLLEHTDLNYGAYASQWRADYVPSDGIGKIDSGNAILSKYPLKEATRIALPLIGDQDRLTQYFYLKRNILRARLDIPGRQDIFVLNVHTSAFSQDGTKKLQIDEFKRHLDDLDKEGLFFIAGGDLNALPPHSLKMVDFDDFVCPKGDFKANDYTSEVGWLDALYTDYKTAIPLTDFKVDNLAYFTHTTDKSKFWNRKLDYLFTNATFTPQSGLTHQDSSGGGVETMPLSDHAPITATWGLP